MKPEIKKQIILHLPYLAFVYLFGKVGQAFRLAQGADLSGKLLHIGQGFSAAFASAAPSFHPTDLLIGLAAAVIIRLVVYSKQKNAKKYRKGMEYGTARWGTAADIKPFIDPVFDNNVLLTQTERLMMSNRPKDPKNARNKNILVIGGSGSGKTRFFCKPNIMQLHSSYVITDPKGSLICEVGQLLQRAKYRIAVLNTINFSKSMQRWHEERLQHPLCGSGTGCAGDGLPQNHYLHLRHRKRRELTRHRLDERRTCGRQGVDRQPPSCPAALSGTNEIPLRKAVE